MKKIGVIFLLMLLIVIKLTSADLILDPTTQNITLQVGETKSFYLTLTNTFNFPIQNFTFSNLSGFSFGDIGILQPNGTKQISVNVNTNYTHDGLIESKVSFFYLIETSDDPITHEVSISEEGYNPQEIIIRMDDSISWINRGIITHTVTSNDF